MSCRPLVATAAVAAALTLTAGCTGGGSNARSSTSAKRTGPAVASLATTWTASTGPLFSAGVTSTSPRAWTTSTSVVIPQSRALTSYSSATGARQWNLALPQDVCAIGDVPNANGIAALAMGTDTGAADNESCATVAAVNLRTGTLLWSKPVIGLSRYGFTDVAVGPNAVVVSNPCDTAVALSVHDGARLRTFAPHKSGGDCLDSFASDGTLVVDGVKHTAHDAFVGYDAVSGRKLWTVPLARAVPTQAANPEVDRVLSSDPVILDAGVNSHRFLRTIDPKTSTQRIVGREADDSYPPVFTAVLGTRVVVQYGQSSTLFAYDVHTGRQVHATPLVAGEFAVGSRGTEVVTELAGTGSFAGKLIARETDIGSGRQDVLGTVALQSAGALLRALTVSGNKLVLSDGTRLKAFTLPSHGSSAGVVTDTVHWAPADVRPATVDDLCTGLTVATKRALQFADPTLPAPARCQWVEEIRDGSVVQLTITATAVPPSGSDSAVVQAQRTIARAGEADTQNNLPAMTAISGVGDQAFTVTSGSLSRVVVRRANVVATIDVLRDGQGSGPSAATIARSDRLAALDMVATIDHRR